MGVVFWIILVMIVVVTVGVFAGLNVKRRQEDRLEQKQEQAIEIMVQPEVSTALVPEQWESVLQQYRLKYNAVSRFVSIPDHVALVCKRTSIFSLPSMYILHYCWKTKFNLYFFPQWEHLESLLRLPSNHSNMHQSYENNLQTTAIPIEKIQYYSLRKDLANTCLQLLHLNSAGYEEISVFPLDTFSLFEKLIPDKLQSVVEQKLYVKSPQNIYDIKDKIDQISQLRTTRQISDEEYILKRTQIILTM